MAGKHSPSTPIHEPRWSPDDYRLRPGPDDYYPELADQIVRMVANGETLGAICANNRDFPLPGDFLFWCAQEAELEEKYRAARSIQAEVLLDAIVEDGRSNRLDANTRVFAGRLFVEKSAPGRYGPKAVAPVPAGKDQPGNEQAPADAREELRRRIEAISSRSLKDAKAAAEGKGAAVPEARGRRA